MLRKFAFMVAWIAWTLSGPAASYADEPPHEIADQAKPAAEDFIDIFHVGQTLSLRTTNVDGYLLTLYTEEQRAAIETDYEEKLKQYGVLEENRQLAEAKKRELAREFQNAVDAQDRERILTELRALGVGGVGAGDARLAVARGRGVPPRPRSTRFYRITKIGKNYVKLSAEDKVMYVPVWSIRSVSQDLEPNQQENVQPGTLRP